MLLSLNAFNNFGYRYNYNKYNSQSFCAKPKKQQSDTAMYGMSKVSARYNLEMVKITDEELIKKYEHAAEQFEFDDENKEKFYLYTQDVIEPWERCNRANTPIYDRQGKILKIDEGKVCKYELNTEICFPYLFPISETALYCDEEGKMVLFKNSRIMASGSYILI